MSTRRDFIKSGSLIGAAGLIAPKILSAQEKKENFWPNARLVISVSMQFEAGGEPDTGADSPFPTNMQKGYPDLPAQTWFQYGYKEGIPRLLDLWDKHNIKVTSHMVGEAVRHNPALAKEIVDRGHEAAAHGLNWAPQYNMAPQEEKEFIAAGAALVKSATGKDPVGYNCNWLRRSKNTISILQELGFTYHIDDLSRDEPFVIMPNDRKFAVVPYTLRCNDIQLIEGRYFSARDFQEQLKLEFDRLYEEAGHRRRQMSISTHDRIGGQPAMVQALDEFFTYATKRSGVKFMRKDDIAKFALSEPGIIVDKDYI